MRHYLRRRRAGVTLLEILVAVSVLAIGLATVFQIFPMGFAASNQSKAKTIAFELAAEKLEEIRNNFLFGGVPAGSPPDYTKLYRYWGNVKAPNPDANPTDYKQVNTDGQYRAFSSTAVPEKNYFYKVDVYPVIDPGRKYQRETFHTLYVGTTSPVQYNEGFVSMWRVAVTVRGPLQSVAEAQDANWSQNELLQKKAVEARLATYVANKSLGDAVLAVRQLPGVNVAGSNEEDNYLLIKGPTSANNGYPNPENFTVFHRGLLSANEILDTGPVSAANMATAIATNVSPVYNMNKLGLDNVVIFKPSGTSGQWIAESNKIKAIHKPNGGSDSSYPNQNSQYWLLVLENNLAFFDQDYPNRETHGSSFLLDQINNGEAKISPNNTGATGYPADETRVRFLMSLDNK